MTVAESKNLKKGNRAYWRGDPADSDGPMTTYKAGESFLELPGDRHQR